MGGIQYETPFRVLARQLRREIKQGKYAPNERLPSTVKMAREYGVSRAVMRNALDMLTVQELLISRNGDGHYIAPSGKSSESTIRDQAMSALLFSGITVKELSERTETPRWTVTRILNGTRPMTVEWAFKIVYAIWEHERENAGVCDHE